MIGVSIAARREWEATLAYFGKTHAECTTYPFGKYFQTQRGGVPLVLYWTGTRKVNAAGANQWMISRFLLEKVIVAGTCAGVNRSLKVQDVVVADRAVQYDCTVKEIEPLIKQSFALEMDTADLALPCPRGTIGTADKAVVMWKDYLELEANGIDIADTEAAAVAWICRRNDVKCIIVKGISDFPTEAADMTAANQQQISIYQENTPKVMQKIFDQYLDKLL